MDKKILFIGGGVVLAFIALVIVLFSGGCNRNNGPVTKTGATTLTFWNLYDDKIAFDQIIAEFNRTHPKVKIEYVKKNPETFLEDSLNEMSAGKGPDIWGVPNTWLPKYHDKLVPIKNTAIENKKAFKTASDVYKETYPSVVAQDNIIDDKVYGFPMSIDTLRLYFNSSLSSRIWQDYVLENRDQLNSPLAKVFSDGPTNWDELVQMIPIITKKKGDKIERSAIAFGTSNNIDHADDIITLLMMQNGAVMNSGDLTTAQFHTKQNQFGNIEFPGTKALEFYTSFADSKNKNYTWNNTMPNTIQAFADEKVVMLVDYKDAEQEIRRLNSKVSLRTIAVPQVKLTRNNVNLASYQSLTVTKASKNSDLAWDFILFMTQDQLQLNNYKLATNKTIARNNSLGSSIDGAQAKESKSWFNPDPLRVSVILKEMIKQVNDGKSAQTAIEGAASQTSDLLKKLKGN